MLSGTLLRVYISLCLCVKSLSAICHDDSSYKAFTCLLMRKRSEVIWQLELSRDRLCSWQLTLLRKTLNNTKEKKNSNAPKDIHVYQPDAGVHSAPFNFLSFPSRRAKNRQGPPLPSVMNIGAVHTVKPLVGSLSLCAAFSRPGIFFSNRIWWDSYIFDCP